MGQQTPSLFGMKDGYEYCKKFVFDELTKYHFTIKETAKESEIKEGCCEYAKIQLIDAEAFSILGTVHFTYALFTLAKNDLKNWDRFKDAFAVKYFRNFVQTRFDSKNMPPQTLIDAVQSEEVYPSVAITFTVEKNGCKAKAEVSSQIRNGKYAINFSSLNVAKTRIHDKLAKKESKKA